MDYMDPMSSVPKKADKLNLSLSLYVIFNLAFYFIIFDAYCVGLIPSQPILKAQWTLFSCILILTQDPYC